MHAGISFHSQSNYSLFVEKGDLMSRNYRLAVAIPLLGMAVFAHGTTLPLDQSPARPGEWGYRPAMDAISAVNPPSFVWRPQKGRTWRLQCASDRQFKAVVWEVEGLELNCHCPPMTFNPGTYFWRYRGKDGRGNVSAWSRTRSFSITSNTSAMPMPPRAELLGRIPAKHPRLFLRPEKLPELRRLAQTDLKQQYRGLVKSCERLLKDPPDTTEPPLYPDGIVRGSDPWRGIWWGNRRYTQKVLGGAATLAFTRLIGGPERYGLEAKRLLLECAKWDPRGSTGYRYNDEAGMPYNYYFSRTYTFVHDLMSESERDLCRKVMKVRGEEMYRHLCPKHIWQPYGSHANRAWHFLGEVAIAFHDEIEGADDWLWFAMNVFYNVYPVWSDADGGWHEGASYWDSYQKRFTWWADVMREAMGVNAFDKPYYSQAGYYAMYLMPPGKVGGGFGDLTARRRAEQTSELISTFAAQAQNPHWQWYVEQLGGPVGAGGYTGFMRGALPKVTGQAPDDLPTSRLFSGIGQAFLNTQITNAEDSVQVAFKSSPFGTQSHGYEANNSFLLWAYGKRLLIRSGYRDSYGSDHHRNWMWSTRSVNNITVNGVGQGRRTSAARGRITAFKTTLTIDVVTGEAASAYEDPLTRFTRSLLFIKPNLLIVYDRLAAPKPSTYEYWLHALNEMDVLGENRVRVQVDDVRCDIQFLTPEHLTFTQTDQYDPNPRPRIKLREWHLTAATTDKKKQMEFVTAYRISRGGRALKPVSLERQPGGYVLQAELEDGSVTALLPIDDQDSVQFGPDTTTGEILIRRSFTDQPEDILVGRGS